MGKPSSLCVRPFDREVAALLLEVFRPRTDLFAWRVDDEAAAARMHGARVGQWYPAGTRAHRQPVSVDHVALHVAGHHTLGFYPLHPDGSCNSISVDFDNHRGSTVIERNPKDDVDALVARLREEKLPFLLHHSRGGKGFWVHLLPPRNTPSREARRVLHGLLEEAQVKPISEGGTFDGLFPKQDVPAVSRKTTGQSHPGNLFCLPLSRRWLANDPSGTGFVGIDPHDFGAQVLHLWMARRIDRSQWNNLAERFPTTAPPKLISLAPPAPSHRTTFTPTSTSSPWEVALRRTGRLGRALTDGRYALLCIGDHLHSTPERTVENARGSCVLFPPSTQSPDEMPWCAHAHCAHLRPRDWIEVIGRDVWDDACLHVRGMRRAGPWLLHTGGITTWFRNAHGIITASRRDVLTDVPMWIAQDLHTERGVFRVIEGVVNGKSKTRRVALEKFSDLLWLKHFGVNPEPLLLQGTARFVEAMECLSRPFPTVAAGQLNEVDQTAVQHRAHDLLTLLHRLHRGGNPVNSLEEIAHAASDE
jgi:hypothetical protein